MRTTLRIVAPLAMLLATACGSGTDSTPPSTLPATTLPATTQASTTAVTTAPPTTAPPTTAPSTTATPTTVALPPIDEPGVALYFVRGETLTVVGRWLGTMAPDELVRALLAGPTDVERANGITSLIPVGTQLRGVIVEGNAATVDLSAEYESMGGSLAVTLAVAQVTYTLTQLPGVDNVWFRIDGEQRDMLTGEGVMVDPATRAEFTDGVLPPMLLEQPFDHSPLSNPIVIAGMTNAFEATVNYQVLAVDGSLLVEGVTTAMCGSGCWGGFIAGIGLPFGTKGPVTLRVFDYSEADGTTMLDLVEVQLI